MVIAPTAPRRLRPISDPMTAPNEDSSPVRALEEYTKIQQEIALYRQLNSEMERQMERSERMRQATMGRATMGRRARRARSTRCRLSLCRRRSCSRSAQTAERRARW